VLTWTAPPVPDPDQGDYIASYRIYRDGTLIANRVASVSGTETTWVDQRTNGATHTYWVRSVDTRLAESNALGPVTG
jgi:hypothetical protein